MNNSPLIADAQAIKNSVIWEITQKELINFFNNYHNRDFRSRISETFLEDVYKRLFSLYCDTAEEGYLKLITKYPEILKLISLKEIASFIKVTPETLSRIRKNLSLKK